MLFDTCRTPVLDGFFDCTHENYHERWPAAMLTCPANNICFSLRFADFECAQRVPPQSVTVCHSGGCEFNISSGPEKAPTGAPDGSLKSPCRRQCECRGGVACFCILKKSFSQHMRGNLQLREKGPQRRVLRSLHFAYWGSRRLVREPVISGV